MTAPIWQLRDWLRLTGSFVITQFRVVTAPIWQLRDWGRDCIYPAAS